MDYEKKYKEALELARVAAFNGHQSLMEGIFPELKESEDEKTRKRIIALVNAHGQGMYKDDMLAWLKNIPYTIDHEKREGFHLGYKAGLEKQGEQNPAWSEADEKFINDIKESLLAYKIIVMDNDTELANCIEKEINWLKSYRPRPKQEWSEEDQNALEDVREAVVHYWGGDSQDILLYWLKSLKQRIKGE